MKLTIKIANGAEAEIEFAPRNMDLWKDTVEIWLEDDDGDLKDYAKFRISSKDKMRGFRKT